MNQDIIESDVSWDELFMRQVYLIASKSKDPKTRIGAVLVRDNVPIIQCFNGFPKRIKDYRIRYLDRDLKRKMVAHAEENTILVSARFGKSTDNTTCYTQGIPCAHCSIALIQGGIKEVVVHKQWPNLVHSPEWVASVELSQQMLYEAGVSIRWFDGKLGTTGLLDGKQIEV